MADRAKTGLGDVSARFSEAIAELHQTWLAWRGRSWTADDELDDAALSDGVVAHADATTPPQRSVTSADDGLSVGPGLPHGPSISARSAGARRVPPPDQ